MSKFICKQENIHRANAKKRKRMRYLSLYTQKEIHSACPTFKSRPQAVRARLTRGLGWQKRNEQKEEKKQSPVSVDT